MGTHRTRKSRTDTKGDSKGERRSDNFLYCHFNIYIHTMWGFDYYKLRGVSMADEYIRKADAIKQCGFGMTSLHIADNLRKMPPADVVPYSISDDGTMTITVPKGMAVGRVFVQRR